MAAKLDEKDVLFYSSHVSIMSFFEILCARENSEKWLLDDPFGHKWGLAITSGILKLYLAQADSWGFRLHSLMEEDGWLGFIFMAP